MIECNYLGSRTIRYHHFSVRSWPFRYRNRFPTFKPGLWICFAYGLMIKDWKIKLQQRSCGNFFCKQTCVSKYCSGSPSSLTFCWFRTLREWKINNPFHHFLHWILGFLQDLQILDPAQQVENITEEFVNKNLNF